MEDRGMRVSRKKTEYLCIGEGETDEEVKMQGEKLKRVEKFKYLGSNCTDGWRNWERGAEENPSRVRCMEEDNESSVRQKSAIKA